MRAIFVWFSALLITSLMVVISYQWLDRPIALFVHSEAQRGQHGWWTLLTHIPNPLVPLALIAFVVLALRALIGRSLQPYQVAALVCSLSVLIAEACKDQLKYIFGRTWPESWTGNNPSFIRDGVYGFHFMHGGGGYNSFPSGHMATTCAVLSVLWFWYPQLRRLWVIAGLAVGAGLVGLNYHFLSDVIAGAFLGVSVGWLVRSIWKASGAAKMRP